MKKLLSIVIILALLSSMCSCGIFSKDVPPDDLPDESPDTEQKPIPSLNGSPLSDYVIVYDAEGLDYNKRAAEYIKSTAFDRHGVELEIVDDGTAEAEREIVVGETSRAISAELDENTEGFEFSILTKDGDIALEADYFVIAAAVYYFMDTYLTDGNESYVTPDGVSIHEPVVKEAKSFILLIGDGMGVYQTKLYDYLSDESEYSDGEGSFYGYMFPYHGFSRTRSLSGVTDSAAGGTALSTGYKTYNEYVGLDKNGNPIKNLSELAGELGKASAVMSTENKTGATPASFSSHAYNRDDSSDILTSQAELTAKHGTVIDCGYDYYTARYMKSIEKHITDTLTKVSADEDGFFLMYEEAHIDKHCHDNDLGDTFLAVIRFNQAIARFMEYAFYNPDTAVIITADHETGGITENADGSLAYTTKEHTAADVPVFAWGMGLDFFDGKTVENVEIGKYIAAMMGVSDFGDSSNDWYDLIYGENKE